MRLNRFQKFRKQLDKLGFSSYSEYLKSPHWAELKNRYRKSKLPQDCFGCGQKNKLSYHHKTYKNLGHERTDQIVAVCDNCHKKIHSSINSKMNKHKFNWNLWKETKIILRKIKRGKGSRLPSTVRFGNTA